MTNIDRKLLAGLRVGDVVRVQSPGFSDLTRDEELVVKITKIDNVEANVDRQGRFSLPVIHWEPRDQDFVELFPGYEKHNVAWCNAGFVTEIIERQPYVVDRDLIQNHLYHVPVSFDRIYKTRHAKCIAIDVYSLALTVVASDPHLTIKYGLSKDKLFAEWVKSGRPGLRGYQTFSADGVVPHKPRHGSASNWMHKPTFKKWLLKRLSYVIRTKKEYRADLIDFQRREEEDYYSDAA